MVESKKFFPLFIDLNEKECLVVGGGSVALRKTKTLLEYGASVTVVASHFKEDFKNLPVEIYQQDFVVDFLKDKFLVVAATDNIHLNEMIYDICEMRGILMNNATSKEDMNTRFSAIIETEEFQIAISAKGLPKKSVKLKNQLIDILKELDIE